jgi:hypothetical protein
MERRGFAMMGRLKNDQGQLFYSFCLEEVVPGDHPKIGRVQMLRSVGF